MKQERFLERPLPSNEQAEQAILGGILLDNRLAASAVEQLTAADFYSPLHKRVFAAMLELFRASRKIDPVTIIEQLKQQDAIVESLGGVPVITALSYGIPHFTSIDEYIDIVRDKSLGRAVIRACTAIIAEACEESSKAADVLDAAEARLFALARTQRENLDAAEIAAEIAAKSLAQVGEMREKGVRVAGFATGLADLDNLTGGLKRGDLAIVAGRPSMGKSALANQAAYNGTTGETVSVIYSLEMTKRQTVDRLICQEAEISLYGYMHNNLSELGWNAALRAYQPFKPKRLYIDDTPALSPMQILARARRIASRHKRLDLIVIDYLQLMQAGRGGGRSPYSREQEVSSISRDLKQIAKELDCAVIALSQLSRACEARNPPRPVLADLRESGAIEQDADLVLFVYRESYYEKLRTKENEGIAELILAKHRNGPTGSVKTAWARESASFHNLEI